MKKFIILLIALFCFSSCATPNQVGSISGNLSPVVYVKVFQTLTKHTALCYQCRYDVTLNKYVRCNDIVINLRTSQFLLYDYGVYKLKKNNIKTGSTYTYETESGKLRTVPIWEYYY